MMKIEESLESKMNGKASYTDDIRVGDMLHGKTLRSSKAYARIKKISYPKLPNGYYVVDKGDIPQKNVVKIIGEDQPVFAEDFVRYIGEPIALFIGEDKGILKDLIGKTIVEYEEVEPVLDIEGEGGEVFTDYTLERGDIERTEREAVYTYRGSFETGAQEHVYMEPQSMIAEYTPDEVVIMGSLQSFFGVKEAVEYCTGQRVRLIQPAIGGGFGGKEDFPSLIACHAALGAIKARKTVKIVYEREEDIVCTTKRHPSRSTYEIYFDRDYMIKGVAVDLKIDAGAYEGLSSIVLELMMSKCCGVYSVPNLRVRGRAIKTNKVSFGAWRGFGAPQGDFGIETALNIFALRSKMDPLEIKVRNLAKRGDPTTTGGVYREELFLKEMLKKVLEKSDYHHKRRRSPHKEKNKLRGVGISFSTLGGGLIGNVEKDLTKSKVRLRKRKDGLVEIYSSIVDMGQGSHYTLRKIVAEVLEVSIGRVEYKLPDSRFCPDSGPTVASRSILIVGKLLERAAKRLRSEGGGQEEMEVVEEYRHPEGFHWEEERHRGDFGISNSFGVNVVEVEVDLLTYRVYPVGYWGVYDIGTPIDHRASLGQVHGGVVQGMGYTLMEVLDFDEKGEILQKNLTDYLIPTAKDSFPMDVSFFENKGEQGPLGAKALGELPFIGVAPAVVLAVSEALDKEIARIPLNPEFLMEVDCEDKL